MASKGDRARARKARTAKAAVRAAVDQAGGLVAPAKVASAPAPGRGPNVGRNDGLDMLLARGRITRAQAETGRHYGMLWRTAQITGGPVKVSDLNSAGGGAGGGVGPTTGLFAADWIADCRAGLARAHQVLMGEEATIAVLDMICGAGMRPREITTDQRDTEQIETVLRMALDMLGRDVRADVRRLQAERSVA